VLGIYAGTGEDEVGELVPVLCDEILRVADTVTEEEMRRVRAQLKAGLLMGLESSSSRAEFLATNVLIYNRAIPPQELIAKIEAVDRAALARAARLVLEAPPTIAALGPIGQLENFDGIAARLKAF
jgi:predicted Zn-dependent peptidase